MKKEDIFMNISFLPDAKKIQADTGGNLLSIAEKAGILIDASCAGAGKCGKCKVKITEGNPGEITPAERELLSENELAGGYRLACCVTVQSDLEVVIPTLHGGSTRKKKMTRLPDGFQPEERILSVFGKVPKASMKYQMNDLGRIAEAFQKSGLRPAPGLIRQLHQALETSRGKVTATFCGDTLLNLEEDDHTSQCFGIAFDIGTTTVVGMLWDMHAGQITDVEARTNYQSIYGADVISRIQFCNEAASHTEVMQKKVVQCMNDILEDLLSRNDIEPGHVYDATIVGNTTMSHLVFGVHPKSMARTPFAPVFCSAQNMRADRLGLRISPYANVFLLPNIAGHVGSDIVGMMLAVRIDSLDGCHIAIDIGTNGEVVLTKNGRMVTCSTAAGPAFEGATIHHGMRAAPGAIESVEITEDAVSIQTIEDLPPIGICGSGLIDAVAQVLDAGIVENSGRMLTRDEADKAGISPELSRRLAETPQGLSFVLAYREGKDDIRLTQQDVREVQLAKGAILAGIQTLMKNLEIAEEDLDSIMLAGAFGNYIRKESALRIGLFPRISIDRIFSVGNAAGSGSSMALLSDAERKHACEIAEKTEHIELSMNMDFQEFYITAMSFE